MIRQEPPPNPLIQRERNPSLVVAMVMEALALSRVREGPTPAPVTFPAATRRRGQA